MTKKLFLTALLFVCTVSAANAQFYLAGDNPGSLKWQYIRTHNYKVIFPKGLDSLATVYARALETHRPRVALSAGYLPGENYWCTTPVVLHPRTSWSNGSVAWAPMRTDLYTMPDAYNPETLPWVEELTIHENRHVAQLQFGADGVLKPFNWLFGEAATGFFAGVFPSYWMSEGDAVVAETALSKFGRGRSSDFLAYYATAFDKGDMRNWEKWRWGSWRHYAPNHYALGYMTVAGARYLYQDPMFTADYLKLSAKRPLKLSKVRSWFKGRSGKKFDAAFGDIMNMFKNTWQADADARGPFEDPGFTTTIPKWYTTYSSLAFGADGNLYAVKKSYVRAAELVKVLPSGKEESLMPFAETVSSLVPLGERFLWTETIYDKRWTLAGESRLRALENGKTKDLSKGRRLFNPATGPDGLISVTEYPYEGGSSVVLLDKGGNQVSRIPAPDGVQIVESAWIGDKLYVTCISDDGMGLVQLDSNGSAVPMLINGPDKINHLKSFGDKLYFISSRGGVGEVYSFYPQDKILYRLTNTKYGVTDYAFNGENLYFAARRYEGDLLCKTEANSLSPKEADQFSFYSYAVADTLSAQEKRLAEAAGLDLEQRWDGEVSAPKNYNKLLNAIRIHSWIPLGINYDEVSDISADETYSNLNLGATVFFQNTLGTLSGWASFAHRSSSAGGARPKNKFNLNLTYTGLYPVISAKFAIGERNAVQYNRVKYIAPGLTAEGISGRYLDMPLIEGDIRVYIPFNFSKGGWYRGFIPELRFVASNDRYNKGIALLEQGQYSGGFITSPLFIGSEEGSNVLMQSVYASARGYVMRPTAHSGVYPSLGIGAELGYHQRMSLGSIYTPQIYGYLYGYLPGLAPEQGLRLSALGQIQLGALRTENAVSTNPRGIDYDSIDRYLASNGKYQLKLTADYAIPFWLGDISALSPFTYIKNFVFTPHFDYTLLHRGSENGGLFSAGASLTAKLANILWFPFDSEAGISISYNGGRSYNDIKQAGYSIDRTYVGFIFKTSI